MRIDTSSFYFDIQKIENRRFMFNPHTETLILGYPYKGRKVISSHAEEHAAADTGEAYDDFIRGWIGTGGKYKNGVIHFAPGIPSTIPEMFNKGFDTLEMFAKNGANKDTVIRAFGEVWEQPLSELIKEVDLMAENNNTHSLENLIEFESTQNTKERVEVLTGILEQGLADLFESERYIEYLTAIAKFHNYSFRNTALILNQLPTASYVAGYNAWLDLDRHVKKGEKGIKIFAPAPYKTKIDEIQRDSDGQIMRDSDGNPVTKEKEITIPAFKVTSVYDISQTDGKPLPELGGGELIGTVENYENFWAVLKNISPFPIELVEFEQGDTAQGYCHYGEDAKITVRNDMSEIETIAAAVHEISHAKLHNYTIEELALLPPEEKKTRRMREVEAESVAFVVCKHFGIETGESSFPYIASWSKDKEMPELKASLSLIQKTSTELITQIEENLIALEKEQQKTQEKPVFDLKSDIHSWYASEFPDDKLGEEIYTGVSFQKLYDMLSSNDVYSIMGVDDSSIRERCFVKLAELMQVDYNIIYDKWLNAEIPNELNPASQPTVTILWSESPHFEAGQKLQLHKADKLFMHLDDNYPEGQGYDKTAFRIDFVIKGEREHYEGRYDIGDKEHGLINHIHKYYEFYRTNEQEQGRIAAQGTDALAEHNAKCDFILNEFVPYLRFHSNLSVMEDTAMSTMKKKTATAEDKAYCSAVCDYVMTCRNEINTAADKYNFPDTPNKADFFVKDNAAEKSKPDKKPSIKKQLAKDKDNKADEPKSKKQTKKKSKEMEV